MKATTLFGKVDVLHDEEEKTLTVYMIEHRWGKDKGSVNVTMLWDYFYPVSPYDFACLTPRFHYGVGPVHKVHVHYTMTKYKGKTFT